MQVVVKMKQGFGNKFSIVGGGLLAVAAAVFLSPANAEISPRLPSVTRSVQPVAPSVQPTLVTPLPEGRRPASNGPDKAQIIERLKNLQSRQVQEIEQLEKSVKSHLKDSTTVSLKDDLSVTDKRIVRLGEQLEEIQKRRAELLARRDFVNRLIFTIDSKWNGQEALQSFLEHQLLDMAQNELTNVQGEPSALWRFVTYLSVTVREVPERRDDVIGIVESYMNFANVINPKTPAEFMANRNYTNGATSVAAHPASRESLGDDLEVRVNELKELKIAAPSASPMASGPESRGDIELRLPRPAPPNDASVRTQAN